MLLQGNPLHPWAAMLGQGEMYIWKSKFLIYMKRNSGHTEDLTGDFM